MELSQSPRTIYVDDETNYLFKDDPVIHKFLNSFFSLLRKMDLASNESIFFYRNGIFFSVSIKRDLIAVIDDIINFVDENESIFKEEPKSAISSARIPKNLQPLFPLLKKYAVSDDADREQLVEEIDEKEKNRLIKSVAPLLKEIDEYLNSFKDTPLSEEAIYLGNLAELVSELMINN